MRIDWHVPIEMDDGNVLDADVYRPMFDGKYPVILSHGLYAKGLSFQDAMLVVLVNNATYNSVRLAGRDGYPDGAQVRHGYVATDFGETPHADHVARACGVAGFRASDGEQLRSTLKQAVETVQAGQPALITVDTTTANRPM